MESFILVATALNKINITVDPISQEVCTYGVKYVKSDGTIGEIYNAKKQVYTPKATFKNPEDKQQDDRTKGMYNLKEKGVVMLINNDATEKKDTFRNIKKAHIIGFRDFQSKKWIEVRH